ncbi:glycosyltransferase family 4 protein [Halobacillus faecis]
MYGANRSLLNMISELDNYGVKPLVICPTNGPLTDELETLNIPYKILPFKLWVSENRKYLRVVARLLLNIFYGYKIKNFIKDNNIDIVHSNSSATQVGAIAANLANTKHVWHIREFLKEDYNLKFDLGIKTSMHFMNKNSSKVIAISKKIKSKYKDYLQEGKIAMIYNGVPGNISAPVEKDQTEIDLNKETNILLIGNINTQKGQRDAIYAIEHLKNKEKINCILNLVGDGPDSDNLKKLTKRLDIEELVNFWGYKSDINEFLNKCDIALMCSKNEAFGRTTIEYMLAGLPVVGAEAGATTELIQHEFNGLLYTSSDYIDLAKKIKYLIEDNEKMEKIRSVAMAVAREEFTSEINASKIHNIYKQL